MAATKQGLRDTLSKYDFEIQEQVLLRVTSGEPLDVDRLYATYAKSGSFALYGREREDRERIVNTFKLLAKAGFGEYRVGRRGHKTRFVFNRHGAQLAREIAEEERTGRHQLPAHVNAPKGVLTHRFALNDRGREVILQVPDDLTDAEVARVTRILAALSR